jgi:hypothetical protein
MPAIEHEGDRTNYQASGSKIIPGPITWRTSTSPIASTRPRRRF